ncbi:GNAT family N-acetyltransferase [Rapidithrix thailandica]|uniref:GNAT family N-acetyltransferase n=1 Tax=Rapidithrix thailandica TaxID=413964 RepID=A0AAW9SGC7_9BACT
MIQLLNDISLSPISLSEQGKLLQLMKEIYPPVYSHLWMDKGEEYLTDIYSKENLKAEIMNPDVYYYFIQYKKETNGILKVITNENVPGANDNDMVKLQRIYISPALQGKGIGKQLIRWVEDAFCKEHSLPLWLEVMDSQEKAINFYEKQGFVKFNRFKFSSGRMKEEYRGMYRMIKSIN